MSKLTNYLHDPSIKLDLKTVAIFSVALKRGEIQISKAPNGSLWFTDREGRILHGLV